MTNESFMELANPRILTINGGSSSIKFALFEAGDPLQRILEGRIERIGLPKATLRVKGLDQADNFSRLMTAPDHTMAVVALMDWMEERSGRDALTAVGHRVVHGGPKYSKPQQITAEMVEELRQLSPIDPEHLPLEIELIETFRQRHPTLPQVACFDTAFHRTMPRVATLLPIPRRYERQGIRRYGFHGLSYEFLIEELARLGDPAATKGRVILAHLGNGASLAAVRDGKSIDTSMGFTPTAGLVMSTRSGDLGSWTGFLPGAHRADERDAISGNGQSSSLGCSACRRPVPTCVTCSTVKRRTCGRQKRSRCFVTRSRNGSAHSRRRWADWTRWCSLAASAKTRRSSASGSAKDWAFSASK